MEKKLVKGAMDDHYRSLLIDNKTSDAVVTLFIYHSNDPLCWLSQISKIINPGAIDIYHSETFFQFELRAHGKKTKRKTIFPATMWEKDYVLRVTGSVSSIDVKKEDLSKHHQEKQICLRRNNMMEESSRGCGRNLYEVLQLNIEEVRKEKDIDKQNARIRKAYHQQLLKWHPDKNPDSGDPVICREIMFAYSILSDPESRAKYNNETDHNKGWLSKSRWKAIFNPECYTKKQRRDYWKRISILVLSSGLTVGALCVSFIFPPTFLFTVGTGAVLGGCMQTAFKTLDRESITEGCSLRKLAAGFVAGAAGGALAGVAGFGVSHVVSKVATTTAGECIAVGSGSGAAGGAIASVTHDLTRKYVYKEKVTWKEVLWHLIAGGVIGATVGLVRGAITKQTVKPVKSSSETPKPVAANVEGTATESVAVETLTEEAAQSVSTVVAGAGTKAADNATKEMFIQSRGKMVGKVIAEKLTANTLQICETVTEERLDKSVENRPVTKHAIDVFSGRAIPDILDVGLEVGKGACSKARKTKIKESKAQVVKRTNPKCKPKFEGNKPNKSDENTPNIPSLDSLGIGDCTNDNSKGRIRFISKGWWWHLKMIVNYKIAGSVGKSRIHEVIGDDCSIEIPKEATNIEVRFQVPRFIGVWCDVKKYDRDNKCWCKPTQPHIFTFNSPPNRVFTLGGPLYHEAVVKVTEGYDEVEDN